MSVLLYILFYFYVNFTFINASLQIADLFLWYLKKRSKCMMVLEKEIKMYVDVMSKSKNSKAIKVINICSSLNIFT